MINITFEQWLALDIASKNSLSASDELLVFSDNELKKIPGSGIGSGGGSSAWLLENGSSAINVSSGAKIIVTPSIGTINLPANPSTGNEINLIGYGVSGISYITINNCTKLEGNTVSNLRLISSNKAVSLTYIDSSIGWVRNGKKEAIIAIGNYYDGTFQISGDTNGIFYYIGTNKLSASFTNPHTAGRVITTSSSDLFNTGALVIMDRINSTFHSANNSFQWVKIDLLSNKSLKLNYYSIKSRHDDNQQHLRTWELQGSNDDSNWEVIDCQNANTMLYKQGVWASFPVFSSTTNYRYFRLVQTGNNSSGFTYMSLGELEFYGELTWG